MKNDEAQAKELYNLQNEVYGQGSIAQMNVELPAFVSVLEKNDLFSGNVIDVGTGTGQLTNFLLQSFPESQAAVSGFDISDENIDQFNEIASTFSNVENGKVASFYDTGYENESFDLAVSNHVLHYAEDLTSALREIRRILKDDAHFIFSSVISDSTQGQHNIIHGILTHEKIDEPIKVWAFQRSKEDILNAVNSAGFALMPYDNGGFFKEFWPEYYYYRPENKNVSIGNPHTFIAVAQAMPDPYINQTVDNTFRTEEFDRQVNRLTNLLEDWGYDIEHKSDIAVPDYHPDLWEVRGGFDESRFVFSDNTSVEDKFFFLLHGIGHIAQWRKEPQEKERSRDFERNLKQKQNLQEHYEHEFNSLQYSVDFMMEHNLERYIKWFLEYFLADQEYIADYVTKENPDTGFDHFASVLENFDVLNVSHNDAHAILRKDCPENMNAQEDESMPDFFIYLI